MRDYSNYGPGSEPLKRSRTAAPRVEAAVGLVVEDVESGWVGAIIRTERSGGQYVVELQDRQGRNRTFTLGPGFWVDGKPVELIPPRPAPTMALAVGEQESRTDLARHGRTASGSRATSHRARVARGGRIWVEGRHDAELVERIWGDDLRYEGVVVEMLDGADLLMDRLSEFAPSQERPVGVLLDHLVPGSKESRLAQTARAQYDSVMITGHPFIDIWQAIKPARVGLKEWPHVPRGTDIKIGTLQALGLPHQDQADIAHAWKQILGRVRSFHDLEPALIGRVEELVDFVTAVRQ